MLPLLCAGDEVLVAPRAYHRRQPGLGEIVVAHHPHRPRFPVIKRITALLDQDHYILSGDNAAESTDSRDFGAVPRKKIVGQVVCRFP